METPCEFSPYSGPSIPTSFWCSADLALGAGMVIIQPTTGKVVVLYDDRCDYWFLPKGRKDVGETLADAALREAYEESGYRDITFLPLHTGTRAPHPDGSASDADARANAEPIFATTVAFGPRSIPRHADYGGEYISFYYVGQIPKNAVCVEGTGMEDEKHFTTWLMPFDKACKRLGECAESHIVAYAQRLWLYSQRIEQGGSPSMTCIFPLPSQDETTDIALSHPLGRELSPFSSRTVLDTHWCLSDFLLSAGMVIFHQRTRKVVLLHDTQKNDWYLPRGRKAVGEELLQAALRQGCRQSGYKVEPLPLFTRSRQPYPPSMPKDAYQRPNTECIMVLISAWQKGSLAGLPGTQHRPDNGGQHLCFYFAGQIVGDQAPSCDDADKLRQRDQVTELLSFEEAKSKLSLAGRVEGELQVLTYAREVYVK